MNLGNKSGARLLALVLFAVLPVRAPARAAEIQACFSALPGGCDPLATVVEAIDAASKTVLVQMYASRPGRS